VIVCPVCGEAFDEYHYQVYSPGLRGTFNRIDCAMRAVAVAARAARDAADEQVGSLGAPLDTPPPEAPSFTAALERGYQPLARYSPQEAR
jgi:hypothetical protein